MKDKALQPKRTFDEMEFIKKPKLLRRISSAIIDFFLFLATLALLLFTLGPMMQNMLGTIKRYEAIYVIGVDSHLYDYSDDQTYIVSPPKEEYPVRLALFYSDDLDFLDCQDRTMSYYNTYRIKSGYFIVTEQGEYQFHIDDPDLTDEQKAAIEEAFYEGAYLDAVRVLQTDSTYQFYNNEIRWLTIAEMSILAIFPVLIFYYLIPLIFKNGQTLGKKVFKIGVVGSAGIRLKGWQMALRTWVGLYLFEVVVSLNPVLPGLGVLVSFFIMLLTKKHLSIHDIIGNTIVVDLSETPIFDTIEEREEIMFAKKKPLG